MGPEKTIEQYVRRELEGQGFKVLKLETPGFTGVMDRLILFPEWGPAPPHFCEFKAPGATERRKQELLRYEFRRRGCTVLEPCDSMDRAKALIKYFTGVAHANQVIF